MTFEYTPPTGLGASVDLPANVTFSWAPSNTLLQCDLLLHMDGTNGSTTFVDSSTNNFHITVTGSAAIETANPKFGTGGMNQPSASTGGGSSIYATITQGGPLDILSGSGDFTIDGWFYLPSSGSGHVGIIFDYGSPPAGAFLPNVGGLQFRVTVGNFNNVRVTNTIGWDIDRTYSFNIVADTWYHFAIVRSATTGLEFINGTLLTDGLIHAPWTGYSFPTVVSVAQFASDFETAGQISPVQLDEIRVCSSALWTANFTPPTVPQPNPGPPPAYTVFRGGVEIGQVLTGGVASFTDHTALAGQTYSYTVAAQDGSDNLLSDFSAPLVLQVPFPAQGKFVGSSVFKAVQISNVGGIIPRVWPAKKNNTVYA